MRLLRMDKRIGLRRIYYSMNKFGLKYPVRRKRSHYRKADLESKTAPNVVNREFTTKGPRRVLLTDITYNIYPKGCCYLSVIMDATTREILAYQISESLEIDFILETVKELIDKYSCELDDQTIIHSNQGSHYTSKAFIEALKDNNFIQSMLRKGNCWDNAPQESFFGQMKDEIGLKIDRAQRFGWVSQIIDDYIDYYNNE